MPCFRGSRQGRPGSFPGRSFPLQEKGELRPIEFADLVQRVPMISLSGSPGKNGRKERHLSFGGSIFEVGQRGRDAILRQIERYDWIVECRQASVGIPDGNIKFAVLTGSLPRGDAHLVFRSNSPFFLFETERCVVEGSP